MGNSTLKIKGDGKIELKINGKPNNNIKEFDFSGLGEGTHECDVTLDKGKPVKILIGGKEVPKNDAEVKRKEELARKKIQEELAQKEREKQEREANKKTTNNSSQHSNNIIADSFSKNSAKLPEDLPDIGFADLKTMNFALKFYKFARFDDKGKASFFSKGQYFIETNNYGLGDKIAAIAERHKKMATSLFYDKAECCKITKFKPDWRVVVGLGTDSVYETGITLHHIYGFPYIPASAIKGIVRSYVIAENYQNKEITALKDPAFVEIFGGTDRQGKVIFFDAMPTSVPQLTPDIMNVHYPDYYGGKKAPTDTQNPIPILFLTVENTEFQFILGCNTVPQVLQTALRWLKLALENKGIGAKTAVGYGYMKEKL
jgi:CRISPR-associated protein Cmr6